MSRVWVLGSAAWDHVYELDEMPATGTAGHARSLGRRAGGSTANVARGLASAGHEVDLVAQLGTDEVGAALLDELATWNVRTDHVVRYRRSTPEALIFVGRDGERTIIVLDKETAAVVPVPYPELSGADALYVGHYRDYEAQLPTYLRRHPGIVMTAVPSTDDLEWFAHLVVGSEREYPTTWLGEPHGALRARVGEQLAWVIVTRGEHGATAYGRHGEVEIPAVPATLVDATGAGDAFAIGLLHGLLAGTHVTAAGANDPEAIAAAGATGARWAAAAVGVAASVPPRWADLAHG